MRRKNMRLWALVAVFQRIREPRSGSRFRHVGIAMALAVAVIAASAQGSTVTVQAATSPTLKLTMTVASGSALASAWTLNAGTSTDSFSGPGPAVGPSPIAAGSAYTIFQSGGPAGYIQDPWRCTDSGGVTVPLSSGRITLTGGQNVTCSTTNRLSRQPSPTPTPTATPAGAAGLPVPASIDATGGSDASAALISWLGTVPNGSTIVFKAGGTYRLDRTIAFNNRHNLTFEGNGATLKSSGGTAETASLFWLYSFNGGNSWITIRNFKLVGSSPTPGVFQTGRESAHGILVDGGSNIEIANVTVSGVWGDCLYVASWADTVSFHDSTCSTIGRSGVSVIAGRNLTVQRVKFDRMGYCTFNVEPNTTAEGGQNVRFLDNTAGTWGNSFFSGDGAPDATVNGVTVSGNTVTNGSLLTVVDVGRRKNLVFTNNRSLVTVRGPVMRFAHVDGLTVTGNVQPLSSGLLATITDSTGVISQ